MEQQPAAKEKDYAEKLRLHLANERTFLAWMRTAISLMAFGFVVAKFDLFIRVLTKGNINNPLLYSGLFGVLFISLGAMINLGAVIRFIHFKREIENGGSGFSLISDYILSVSVLAVAVTLVIYFIRHVIYG